MQKLWISTFRSAKSGFWKLFWLESSLNVDLIFTHLNVFWTYIVTTYRTRASARFFGSGQMKMTLLVGMANKRTLDPPNSLLTLFFGGNGIGSSINCSKQIKSCLAFWTGWNYFLSPPSPLYFPIFEFWLNLNSGQNETIALENLFSFTFNFLNRTSAHQ